MAMIKDKVSD